jgi:hypothetical protein
MSIPQRRKYESFDVDFEQLSQKSYCGKISYKLIVAAKIIFPSTDSSSTRIKDTYREYKTKPYSTPEEAFINVMGWVDCNRHYNVHNDIPKDNEDSYQKKYKELLKELENKRFEKDITNSQTSKEERKLAYQEGWESKILELNNMEIINPE